MVGNFKANIAGNDTSGSQVESGHLHPSIEQQMNEDSRHRSWVSSQMHAELQLMRDRYEKEKSRMRVRHQQEEQQLNRIWNLRTEKVKDLSQHTHHPMPGLANVVTRSMKPKSTGTLPSVEKAAKGHHLPSKKTLPAPSHRSPMGPQATRFNGIQTSPRSSATSPGEASKQNPLSKPNIFILADPKDKTRDIGNEASPMGDSDTSLRAA